MQKLVQSVTKTMQAIPNLPVAQERAQMSPERVAEQKRATFVAFVAWSIGGIMLYLGHATPVILYAGLAIIAYGFAAFDFRLFKDILSFVGQLVKMYKDLKKETPS